MRPQSPITWTKLTNPTCDGILYVIAMPHSRPGGCVVGRIFINYRRADDPGFARALYQLLEAAFPAGSLFMDVEGHIRPGQDFVQALNSQVASTDVVLVVIGERWLDLLKAHENDQTDFVAIEIKAALDQDKLVIPVLVGGAQMPRPEVLPESIRPLARRHAVALRPERFKSDCQSLIAELKAPAQGASTSSRAGAKDPDHSDRQGAGAARRGTLRVAMAAVVAIVVAALGAAAFLSSPQPAVQKSADTQTKHAAEIAVLRDTPSSPPPPTQSVRLPSVEMFDGYWYSSVWKYGYRLRNGVGIATSTNSVHFSPGDEIIRLQHAGGNRFTGTQIYQNGKWYRITGRLDADGRLYIDGEHNYHWHMDPVRP